MPPDPMRSLPHALHLPTAVFFNTTSLVAITMVFHYIWDFRRHLLLICCFTFFGLKTDVEILFGFLMLLAAVTFLDGGEHFGPGRLPIVLKYQNLLPVILKHGPAIFLVNGHVFFLIWIAISAVLLEYLTLDANSQLSSRLHLLRLYISWPLLHIWATSLSMVLWWVRSKFSLIQVSHYKLVLFPISSRVICHSHQVLLLVRHAISRRSNFNLSGGRWRLVLRFYGWWVGRRWGVIFDGLGERDDWPWLVLLVVSEAAPFVSELLLIAERVAEGWVCFDVYRLEWLLGECTWVYSSL